MTTEHSIQIRIPKKLYQQMIADLKHPHEFAYERVGFLMTRSKLVDHSTTLIMALEYHPVLDENYIEDNSVGAKINSSAIRSAMQTAHDLQAGCFHVHLHEQSGRPHPSLTDSAELPPVVASLANISSKQCNGFLILSEDSFHAEVKMPGSSELVTAEKCSVIGYPMKFQFEKPNQTVKSKVHDRQSFLGIDSQFRFENIAVGIIGYGGGGSHIGQQLAHLGVVHQTIFDDDVIDETNLNRLIGGWFEDAKKSILKTTIAQRLIEKVLPHAKVVKAGRWQHSTSLLEKCDIVLGCVDSYDERNQLEAHCRRYLIPYIDIGMDIHSHSNNQYGVSGQVILSMPEAPCMRCHGFLTEEKLAREAAKYGDIGGRPQVVWSNGVLASTAVGIFVDLVTGWSGLRDKKSYIAYDGNSGKMDDHIRLKFSPSHCDHYPLTETGPPVFKKL